MLHLDFGRWSKVEQVERAGKTVGLTDRSTTITHKLAHAMVVERSGYPTIVVDRIRCVV